MTNKIIFSTLLLLLCSCSHSLKFSGNHFALPTTAETQWGGHASIAASGTTTVTVVDDITTNPPSRDNVLINERTTLDDAVYVTRVGFNGALSVIPSLEVYLDNSVWGLRWQFLNFGTAPDNWVGAIQAGYGKRNQGSSYTSSTNASSADSDIKTTQAGISIGYKLPVGSAPYVSYVYESHDVTTKVQNNLGTYPEYTDHGVHQYASVGIASYNKGLDFAIEYSFIDINWDRSARTGQGSLGGMIGFAW